MSTTSTSTQQHREMATEEGPVAVAIVTVSDTRTPETDKVFLAGHYNAALTPHSYANNSRQRETASPHIKS